MAYSREEFMKPLEHVSVEDRPWYDEARRCTSGDHGMSARRFVVHPDGRAVQTGHTFYYPLTDESHDRVMRIFATQALVRKEEK